MNRLWAFPFVFFFLFALKTELWIYKFSPAITFEHLMFFIRAPIAGVAPDLIFSFLEQCILESAVLSILICYMFDILCLIPYFKKKLSRYAAVYTKITALLFAACFASFIYDKADSLSDYITKDYSTFYEENFVTPTPEKITFTTKKNLLLIYLESMEETFGNSKFFAGSLIPDLQKLETEGSKLGTFINGYASDFTQGSIVAAFCGVPSTNFIDFAELHPKQAKNIWSLGKILKDNGYSTHAVMGSYGWFHGTKLFLAEHGIDSVIDRSVIEKNPPENAVINSWGYSDENTFSILKDKISRQEQRPYFIMAITIDSHFQYQPQGLNEENKFSDKYKNIIYNTNKVTAEFISWFKTQPDYKNTVIVIVGDHLRMGNDFEMPEQRGIYNLFLNAPKPENTNRIFSQIDLFPTLIEAIGGNIDGHKLGLGTSLFSNEKTLAERFSQQELQNNLKKRNKLYDSLWR